MTPIDRFIIVVVLASVCLIPLSGCADQTDKLMVEKQHEIAEDAIKHIPILQQFCERFPDGHHFITYVTGKEGPSIWNSKAGLFGRYIVEMQIPASIDRKTFKLSLVGKELVQIREITEISLLPDGRQEIGYGETVTISDKVWKDFLAKNLSLDQLGINFIKDRPLPEFKDVRAY